MVWYNISEARTEGRDEPGRFRVEDLSHQRLARQCSLERAAGQGRRHHTTQSLRLKTFTARSGGPVQSGAGLSAPRALCLSCLGFLSGKQNSKRSDGCLACLLQGCTEELRSPGQWIRVHCTSSLGFLGHQNPKSRTSPFPIPSLHRLDVFPVVSWSQGCG